MNNGVLIWEQVNMKEEKVPFFVPNITKADKNKVKEALASRWLTGGPRVDEFANNFANYVGTKHAIAVNSCTAALHLTSLALGIGEGDEVIVPTLTFAATANAPLFCGATPVFADIDEETFNISPRDILKRITKNTKAIIVVHYAGQPCDMDKIIQIAKDHKLFVIEDCAHSLGASYLGKQTGSIGHAGCFSFYPTKNITTLEGGMVTTDDGDLAQRIRLLRCNGVTREARDRNKSAEWYYDVVELGYNYRLNEIQAALGISQLSRIDKINQQRIKRAHYYTKKLANLNGIILPFSANKRTHVYHLYAIRVVEKEFGLSRDQLYARLSTKGIGLAVHYTPLHLLSYYAKVLGSQKGDYPVAETIAKEVLSLPLFPTLKREQMDYVIHEVLRCHSHSRR
jgi:dTDP-4-amino-4,6-dideoxygalactose transaminase